MGSKVAWTAAGMAATAVAIGVGEVVAGLFAGTSLIAAIGALVIALQPPGAKDLMVSLFGTNDKLALEIGVFIGGVLIGSLLGLVARRERRISYAAMVVIGLVGLALVMQDPLEDPIAGVITAGAAVAAGIAMLQWLGSVIDPSPAPPAPNAGVTMPRRTLLVMGATFVAVGAVLSVIGRVLGGQVPTPTTAPGVIPQAQQTVPPMAEGADLGIAGLTPSVVPNDDFYLIDTRLGTPHLDSSTWSLRVHGMVDRELTLTYDQLLAMPLVEQYVTIACVSNEVGGHLVGNAKWTGVPLNMVLDMAGVQDGATQLIGRSYDQWTSGFPTAHLSGAGRDALIVVKMNDEPLPARHGFPARLIVPGLYGYVSATKWITEIELNTLDAFNGYWVNLGWAKLGPILTQSRIDVPRPDGAGSGSEFQFAGVAWAPTRKISKVEIDIDQSGNWQPAQLSTPLSDYAWVQWQATAAVAPGGHTVRVRATDGTGAIQEERSTPPAPDGARGYHSVNFSAT